MNGGISQPQEIRLNTAERVLEIDFDAKTTMRFPAELLRVESPSAELQGHSPSEKKILGGKRNVAIIGLEPAGNYAVIIKFDDGHQTGIYSWEFLYRLGQQQDGVWQTYVDALAAAGLSRDP
jgi:DUF971 family protein